MATPNLGRIMMMLKDEYENARSYVKLDIVSHLGGGYCCKKPCIGIPPTNTEYWLCIARRGDDGQVRWNALTAQEKESILSSIETDVLGFTHAGGFRVTDADGNVVISYAAGNGLDTAMLSDHIKILIREIDGWLSVGTISGTAFDGKLGMELGAKVNRLDLRTMKFSNFLEVEENGLYVCDTGGNIGMRYDADGLDFAVLSPHAKEVLESVGIGGVEYERASDVEYDV